MAAFWGSLFYDRNFRTETDYYGLTNAFMCGMLEGADPGTRLIDGNEGSYYYAERQDYSVGYNRIKNKIPGPNNDTLDIIPEDLKTKYIQQVECGQAIWGDLSIVSDKVFWALESTDHYVWMWTEFKMYLDDIDIDRKWPKDWPHRRINPADRRAILEGKAKYKRTLGF